MNIISGTRAFILRYRWALGIGLAALILRFWHLSSLPPGATVSETNAGLAALNLGHHARLWSAGITPLTAAYSWLSAPFLLIGHNLLWLRLVAAVASLLSVVLTYFWLRDWRSRQDGLVGAVVMTALAWQILLGREAGWASLVPPAVAAALWLVCRWEDTWAKLCLGILAGISFYISPALWWLAAAGLVYLISQKMWHRTLPTIAIAALLAAPALIWIILNPGQLGQYFAATGSLHRVGQFLVHLVAAGGDWQLTAGAQPLFNAFYAIMAVLGLVVSLLRWRTSQMLLVPLVAGLLAGAFDPSGEGFTLALVPLVGLVAAGIATMLEWWYATFPINAAARTSGRAAIGLILALATYQGYVQYFVAFANSTQTYAVYREDAWQMAAELKSHPGALVIADEPARAIVSYRNYPKAVRFATVKTLPKEPKVKFYIIGYGQRAAVETALAGIAPGGKLRAHTSAFDGRELFYTYEVK